MITGMTETALDLAIHLALPDPVAFFKDPLALPERQLDLHQAVALIHAERDNRQTMLCEAARQAVDFPAVHQQLAHPRRLDVEAPALLAWTDMHIIQEKLAPFNAGKAVVDADAVLPDGFDLGPFELQAGFKRLKKLVISPGLVVGCEHRLAGLPRLGHALSRRDRPGPLSAFSGR